MGVQGSLRDPRRGRRAAAKAGEGYYVRWGSYNERTKEFRNPIDSQGIAATISSETTSAPI
jgi:hypothetical protein